MPGITRGSWSGRRLAVLALATVIAVAANPAEEIPAAAQPEAVVAAPTMERVVWLSDRRVALWVHSPAMGRPIQVQLLLAKDWNARPEARFPVLFMLDGLRADDDENGWTKQAGAVDFFADKNLTVVLPIGGMSSFYADWLEPNNGHNYKWETFLTDELPPLLESRWRATPVRGVQGLSMGGTAAMFLTARNPGFARYAGSYSGFLTTTTLGMPQAIDFAVRDVGGFDSAAMWGPPTSPEWAAHDPYLLADQLRGVSLYVSSGSGATGPFDQAAGVPGMSTNIAGMGLEILSRLTSQNFVTKLAELAIPARVNYRPSGTHSWPYWDFEMRQSWNHAGAALGVDPTVPECATSDPIAAVAALNDWLGECLTNEYPAADGMAQDFRGGRVFRTPDSGEYPVGGAIGAGYQAASGPAGALGLPTDVEGVLPDDRGRFQRFRHGALYWTPQTGAQAVHGAIFDEWSAQGFEHGVAGYPVGPEGATPNGHGVVQPFEHALFYFSPGPGAHRVQGLIRDKYGQLGYEESFLGFPVTDEQSVRDLGRFSGFEGGAIYWSPASGAWAVRNGPILDAWRETGYENGDLGFPVSDEFPVPGGVRQTFEAGFIEIRDGKPEVHRT